MNITNIQSAIAPVLAPIAPAILFGNNLHAGMIADGVDKNLALAGSILGTGGVELSGALACSMAVMAYHRKDTKIMWISVGAAGIYAVFVMIGIMQARNTATFAGAVIISLVAYLMQGVWQSYSEKLRTEQAEVDMQVKAMEAERRLQNARNRGLKLSSGGQTGGRQATQFVTDAALIDAIRAYWRANPAATTRDCAAFVGCSPTTAGKYKPEEVK